MSDELLEQAAVALGPLVDEVVFLGGASISLWVSDPAAPVTRATDDVDVIADITSLSSYYALGERLRERGFSEDHRSKAEHGHFDVAQRRQVMAEQADRPDVGRSTPERTLHSTDDRQ